MQKASEASTAEQDQEGEDEDGVELDQTATKGPSQYKANQVIEMW